MRRNSEDIRALRDYQAYLEALQGYITFIPIYEQTGQGIRISKRARALKKIYKEMNKQSIL